MNEAKGWNRAEGWGVSLRSIIVTGGQGARPILPIWPGRLSQQPIGNPVREELVRFPGQIIVFAHTPKEHVQTSDPICTDSR